MSRLLGIAHASVVVAQMERSLRFYRDLLGLSVESDVDAEGEYVSTVSGLDGANVRIVLLSAGDPLTRLELLEFRAPVTTGTAPVLPALGTPHVAFLTDDIHGAHALLLRAGVRVISPPATDGEHWAMHLLDPDGIRVELMQRAV